MKCNIAAVEADDHYVELTGNGRNSTSSYRMHNHHFVVWCAMFDGQYETALKYARKAVDTLPAGDRPRRAVHARRHHPDGRHLPRVLRHDGVARHDSLRQVGRHPRRADVHRQGRTPGTIAVQHYARGVAYASKGMVPEAEAEQACSRKP